MNADPRDEPLGEQVREVRLDDGRVAAGAAMTASPVRRVVVPVVVLVDEADYQLAYGDLDDIAAYTAQTIRAVAKQQMDRLGWGQVQFPEQGDPIAAGPG